MTQQSELDSIAAKAFKLLLQTRQVIVTAESCTAGLIAATLSRIPGMLACLAGSFVVYQVASKVALLELSEEMIARCNVVSSEVAESMANQALSRTAHATVALSITGHLGPDAPTDLDGIAWLGFAGRASGFCSKQLFLQADTSRIPGSQTSLSLRQERQQNAVAQCLEFLCQQLTEGLS